MLRYLHPKFSPNGTAGQHPRKPRTGLLSPDDPRRVQGLSAKAGLDPLVSSWSHNRRRSPLYRLPNELLTAVIQLLCDDDLTTLFTLRLVSGRLYRLVSEQLTKVAGHSVAGNSYVLFAARPASLEGPGRRSRRLKRRYEAYMARCQFCGPCRAAYRGLGVMPPPGDDEGLLRARKWSMRRYCRLDAIDGRALYCAACACDHPASSFSAAQRGRGATSRRVCVGREGRFRLCEHRSIQWAEIEDHLVRRQSGAAGGGGSSAAPIVTFRCEDASHGPCGLSTDAAATAAGGVVELECFVRSKTGRLRLRLRWRTHRIIRYGSDGRLNASDLRRMFDACRRSLAWLAVLPARGTPGSSHPEMACFDPSFCRCLRYRRSSRSSRNSDGAGTEAETVLEWESRRTGPDRAHESWDEAPPGKHSAVVGNCLAVSADRCDSRGGSPREGERCVVVEFARELDLGEGPGARHNPPHEWFHLLDPDSYDVSGQAGAPGAAWTACNNPRCAHYRRLTRCPAILPEFRRHSLHTLVTNFARERALGIGRPLT